MEEDSQENAIVLASQQLRDRFDNDDASNVIRNFLSSQTYVLCKSPSGILDIEIFSIFFDTLGSTNISHRTSFGYADVVRNTILSRFPAPATKDATLAVAKRALANAVGSIELERSASESYILALDRMRADVRGLKKCDTTMLTALLLDTYEASLGALPSSSDRSVHERALPQLIEYRGFNQLRFHWSRVFFFNYQTQVLHASLARGQSYSDQLGAMANVVCLDTDNPGHQLQRISLVVPGLVQRAHIMMSTTAPSVEQVKRCQTLFAHMAKVSRELEAWEKQAAQQIPATQTTKDDFYASLPSNLDDNDRYTMDDVVHVYSDVASAGLWNLLRVIRIHVLSATFLLQSWADEYGIITNAPERNDIESRIRDTIRSIIASVPAHLGNMEPESPGTCIMPDLPSNSRTQPAVQDFAIKGPGALLMPLYTCRWSAYATWRQIGWIDTQIARCLALTGRVSGAVEPVALAELSFSMFARAISFDSGQHHGPLDATEYELSGVRRSIAFACLDVGCFRTEFDSYSSLKRHQIERHIQPRSHKASCQFCSKTFSRVETLNKHLISGACGPSAST